ncbi:hypothetical protein, partial [Anaerotignum lactatifermentans]|uniref:hypothetical protein n=1 Tax=Anaerotignum lactatifermentans TaxID=160404 RepID=UPI0027BA8578
PLVIQYIILSNKWGAVHYGFFRFFVFVKEMVILRFLGKGIFADYLTNSSDLEGFGIQIIRIQSNFVWGVYTFSYFRCL